MKPLCAVLTALVMTVAGGVFAPSAMARETTEDELLTLGFIETAFIGELTLEMSAKLDTGADSSSVYARDVRVFEKSRGDDWVRYRLIGDDGRTIRFEKNVVRYAQIKTKRGGTIRRPVVLLDVCLGGRFGVAEFNLADRDQFDYDVLIGREFLASRILVDSGRRYTADGACDDYLDEKMSLTASRDDDDAADGDTDVAGTGDAQDAEGGDSTTQTAEAPDAGDEGAALE